MLLTNNYIHVNTQKIINDNNGLILRFKKGNHLRQVNLQTQTKLPFASGGTNLQVHFSGFQQVLFLGT